MSGTQLQGAASCTITCAACGALQLRVRLDRFVRPGPLGEHERKDTGAVFRGEASVPIRGEAPTFALLELTRLLLSGYSGRQTKDGA